MFYIFDNPHFPHSLFSTPRIFHTPCFPPNRTKHVMCDWTRSKSLQKAYAVFILPLITKSNNTFIRRARNRFSVGLHINSRFALQRNTKAALLRNEPFQVGWIFVLVLFTNATFLVDLFSQNKHIFKTERTKRKKKLNIDQRNEVFR